MATLNYKILPTRRKASGKLGIYLAVTFKKQVRYISTEFEVDDESQFENGKVCYRKDASIINKRMQYVISEYQERMDALNLKKFQNCAELKEALMADREDEMPPISISELFNQKVHQLKKEERFKYARMHECSLKVILKILKDMPISYLTRSDIKLLDSAMRQNGYSNSTVHIVMALFKSILNVAIDNKQVEYLEHPFYKYRMPYYQARMMDITQSKFQQIANMEIENKKIQIARDLWLLSFYLGGINLVDLVKADLSKDILSYERSKTKNKKRGDKTTVLLIQPEARAIINKYIANNGKLNISFKNYDYFLVSVDYQLRKLKKMADINQTRFSFYSARKTFAQFAFEIGVRTEVIEYCIGQSMKSNRPIYNYVRVMQKYADEAIRQVIDYAFSDSPVDAQEQQAATVNS